MIERGWSDLHKRWAQSRPPLRPHPQGVEAMWRLLQGLPGPRLLLGVTPELATLPGRTVAIDWSAEMIAQIWPGNSADRVVVRGDWTDMPFASGQFGSVLGDGSLNMTRWPMDYHRIFDRLKQVVRPGGRIVIRCFTVPETGEGSDELAARLLSGERMGFHAFKWRLAAAIVHETQGTNIPVRAIWDMFERLFPDRHALSLATGWSTDEIAEIDDYRSSPLDKSFPTRSQLIDAIPEMQLVESGSYEMADRCPLLLMDVS